MLSAHDFAASCRGDNAVCPLRPRKNLSELTAEKTQRTYTVAGGIPVKAQVRFN